jgi:putative phage-type endonuclease
MTLTILPDLLQGSEEWHDQRRGMVTASVVGQLLTPTLKVADNDTSRALTRLLVAERITGYTDPTCQSDDMFRGVISEPIARDIYSGHYQQAVEVGFMVRQEDDWELGYSPDGVVGMDGLVEIKSPRAKTHLNTILTDRVPAHYVAQLQAGLVVSGRAWIDYVSYVGGMPLFVKRVYPDPGWAEAIVAACRGFQKTAIEMFAAYRKAIDGLPMTERLDLDLEVVI